MASDVGRNDKLVFAHYMVCCPAHGGNASISDYAEEIRQAQNRGIDGFALNVGGWLVSEPHYKKRVSLIYAAAELVSPSFQLFISADRAARGEIADIINSFRNHPNQLRVSSRPVLSMFGGQGSDGKAGIQYIAAAHQNGAFFIPYYYPLPANELPSATDVKFISKIFHAIDGYFYYGAAGTGSQLSEVIRLHAEEWRSHGKIFMSGVTPFYRGSGSNFRFFETRGFESMALEWETSISQSVDWIQIVTWNDWYESSYVSPFDGSRVGNFGNLPNSNIPPHTAYLDASAYYIEWFKSGHRPLITQDKLFYFYKPHLGGIPAPKDPYRSTDVAVPKGNSSIQDRVFVTVFLKSPATVVLISGSHHSNFNLDGGVHHVSIASDFGEQRFLIKRFDKLIIEKKGDEKIQRIPRFFYNYYSGSAFSKK